MPFSFSWWDGLGSSCLALWGAGGRLPRAPRLSSAAFAPWLGPPVGGLAPASLFPSCWPALCLALCSLLRPCAEFIFLSVLSLSDSTDGGSDFGVGWGPEPRYPGCPAFKPALPGSVCEALPVEGLLGAPPEARLPGFCLSLVTQMALLLAVYIPKVKYIPCFPDRNVHEDN